ncbi:MAG: ArsA family ATPase [Gemmatimonadaceae bacterium]
MSTARAPTRRAVDDFLDRLPRLTLVAGKGGVGKTTCAMGIAGHLSSRGKPTLLVSTDPANSLGPMLGVSLRDGEICQIADGFFALQLDPMAARRKFLERWRDVLVTIVDRGTYLDVDDIGGLVDAAFPGADEIFGLLVLAQILARSSSRAAPKWRCVVVDTAPTGHTLRLLGLPETFESLLALLDSMQGKHRFMVSALTHRYRPDAADAFLDEMRGMIAGLRKSLGDAEGAGAVLVTRAQDVVVSETERYAAALRDLNVRVVAVVVEAYASAGGEEDLLARLAAIASSRLLFAVPKVDPPPAGSPAALASLGEMAVLEQTSERSKKRVRAAKKGLGNVPKSSAHFRSGGGPQAAQPETREVSSLGDLLRTFTIVGGKGGVGKTTVSCALALFAAHDHTANDTLLVSTDPAPSIGDALGMAAPRWAHDGPIALPKTPHLYVWQMDATTAFRELRERYQDRIDIIFDSLMGRNTDMAHDRAIVRDLLSLAPPGVDELYALVALGDALEEGRYARVVVDPAPTGHLMRLLQMPTLAIEWSHRLMRLILKYKEVANLGAAAQDLLNFSRRTRALDELLHDPARAGIVLVSLDEPAVTAETARLAELLRSTGITVIAEIRNRVTKDAHGADAGIHLAPESDRPLVGVDAIQDWSRSWRREWKA